MISSLIMYTLIVSLTLFFAQLYQKKALSFYEVGLQMNYSLKFKYIILIIFIPVFFAGLRYDIGTDYTPIYTTIYNIIATFSFTDVLSYNVETSYSLINYFSNLIFPSHIWIVFMITSFITLYFFIEGLSYFERDISLSLSLYIYFMFYFFPSLNIQRQMLAVSIIIFAYKFIIEKKFWKYLFFIVFAMSFHRASIIALTFYFLNFKRGKYYQMKSSLYYLSLIVSPVFLLFIISIGESLPFVGVYFTNYEIEFIGIGLSAFLDLGIVLLPALIFKNKIENYNSNYSILINISYLLIPATFLSFFQHWAFRIRIYITITQLIILPMIVKMVKNKNEKRLVTFFLCLFYLSLFILKFIIIGEDEVLPFKSLLQIFNFG